VIPSGMSDGCNGKWDVSSHIKKASLLRFFSSFSFFRINFVAFFVRPFMNDTWCGVAFVWI